jgi:predicted TPR repeat methyltransferase
MMMMKRIFVILLCYFLIIAALPLAAAADISGVVESLLEKGDELLGDGSYNEAIEFYQRGIRVLGDNNETGSAVVSLQVELSLHTNLATAYSMLDDSEHAADSYHAALWIHKNKIKDIDDADIRRECDELAAHASFFVGMVYQDLNEAREAIDAYEYALSLNPRHWSSAANLGSVYHDDLQNFRKALHAYQVAYDILTSTAGDATDPPPEPRFILSQLQYRMGLCLTHSGEQKCAMQDTVEDDPNNNNNKNKNKTLIKVVDCNEMAAHAFSLALEYDAENDSARHMLASVTADATVKRASNTYVKSLFDEYAVNFEHSLVQELLYTGYERLRKGFDRAMTSIATTSAISADEEAPPTTRTFDLVLDAGCGTGLVGQEFRNISKHLIGVDLSQVILDQAVELRPQLYDETLMGDVTVILQSQQFAGRLQLIIAADSFIYFGDFDPVLTAINRGLERNAYVAFTLENVSIENERALAGSSADWRWQLQPSGRFAHRKSYVETSAQRHGLQVIYYETLDGFRYEQGAAVRGHLFVLQKTNKDTAPATKAMETNEEL